MNITDNRVNLIYNNGGSAPSSPVYGFTFIDAGAVIGIEIANHTTVQRIEVDLTGQIEDGDYLEISSEALRVLKNAEPIDFEGVFPELLPGNNNITVRVLTSNGLVRQINQKVINTEYYAFNTFFLAQSFTPTVSGSLDELDVLLRRIGESEADITVSIFSDSGGLPNASLASKIILSSSVSNEKSQWKNIVFASPPTLTAGTRYWIVVSCDNVLATNPIAWLASNQNPYASYKAIRSTDSGSTWSNLYNGMADFAFKIYIVEGGATGHDIDFVATHKRRFL